MATSTVENYLKAILHLEEESDSGASVGALAEVLEVTPGTVSVMMKHLASEALVEYIPRKSICLLPEGREQALQVVRRHRLLETFLVQIMKLDWSEVHDEAEILEHVISDRLIARIDEMLGFPDQDPHGDPIPNESGQYPPSQENRKLSEVEEGTFRLVRVEDTSAEFLDWLKVHALVPGMEFRLLKNDIVAGLLSIQPVDGGDTVQVGQTAAARMLVENL